MFGIKLLVRDWSVRLKQVSLIGRKAVELPYQRMLSDEFGCCPEVRVCYMIVWSREWYMHMPLSSERLL